MAAAPCDRSASDSQYLLGDPQDMLNFLADMYALLNFPAVSSLGMNHIQADAADPLAFMDLLLDLRDMKQLPADSSLGVNHIQADVADPSQLQAIRAAGIHPGCEEQSPVAVASADSTIGQVQVGLGLPEEPPADVTLSTITELEVAEMVRVAAECGEDDDARTTWSEEEHKLLIRYHDLYADCDDVKRCFKIAFHLPKKTARDVALRWRWLQDKRKTATSSAPAKPAKVKVKETKFNKIGNEMYPLSKEALDSRSSKELIRDNHMFLKRIEENLKTGQLENTSDYFYYVKTNMDVILKRGDEFGIHMTMPPIDEQGLDEILRDRLNSLSLKDDA